MRAAILALLVAGSAAADPAPGPWDVPRGTVEPGLAPGSLLLSTDASPGRFSEGRVVTHADVVLPYALSVTWRRLGPEGGRSQHVMIADGVVLLKTGAIALYHYDEAAFAAEGWRPLLGYDAHGEHRVVVRQDAARVTVVVDDRAPVVFALATPRRSARVGVGMKGAPGLRSQLYLRELSVAPAATPAPAQ